MSISQVLFDAIQRLELELKSSAEYGQALQREITELIERMKVVQRKLDAELTEIDTSEEE
jgi:hypothetical protein